jgi:photosystem II stability/assembly factor-like uncharacterized protein
MYGSLLTLEYFQSKIRHVSNAKNVRNAQTAKFLLLSLSISSIVLISFLCQNIYYQPAYPAAAASDAVKWARVNIPTEGEAGKWALADGSDIQHIAMSGDGTLYAYVTGLDYTLYRSKDGGYGWEYIGGVQDEITGIAVSPHDAGTVYYATTSEVYRSTNGGRTFTALPPGPGGAGTDHKEITSIDVAWTNGNIILAGITDKDSGEFGGVFLLDEAEVFSDWADTGIGDYDICTLAFSPDFAADRRIVAVTTDESDTYIMTKIGNTEWNAEIGYARLDAVASSAEIAFPNIESEDVIPEEIVCYLAIATGTGEGDVYKIEADIAPGTSLAIDLNAGSACGQSDIDISGLAVYGDETGVTLLAGAMDNAEAYISTDGGERWTGSLKSPTGSERTGVLLSNDFRTTNRMYAFTSGDGSAISISRDSGETWNQLSLIDVTLETITDLAPSPRYDQDTTLFMLTSGKGLATMGLWRSQGGGNTWERTLTSQPDTVDSLYRVALPPQYGDDSQTIFLVGESYGNPAIWESTDNGQSYHRRFPRNPTTGEGMAIDVWAVVDDTTLNVGSYDGSQGMVFKTVNKGLVFADGMPAGNQPLHSIALSPDHARDGAMLCGDISGRVYWTDNNSTSFQPLPGDAVSPPFSARVTVTFDPEYGKNHTVYAASSAVDEGVYRFVVGTSTEWESIDDTLPSGAMFNGISAAAEGTLYTVNSDAEGGLERSLNPDFTPGPTFDTVTRGLDSSATLYGLWQVGHRIWSIDTTNARLMLFHDTLTEPVTPVSPEPEASGTGTLIDHTVRNINLDWDTMEGATGYEWECGYNDDFSATPGEFGEVTSASSARLPALEPATTYHWRVRVSSPVLSPWSEKRSFTTVMDTESITLKPESPTTGASGVPLQPVFQWTAILGAEAYELLVCRDAALNHPVISMTDGYAIRGNAWQCNVSLDYATTYYWKVRAINASTYSAWSTTGVFTTVAAPTETEAPGLPAGQVAAMIPEAPTPDVNPTTPAPPTPPPASTLNGIAVPALSQPSNLAVWIIYLIGGLLAIVILSLVVILLIVLKIKRIT